MARTVAEELVDIVLKEARSRGADNWWESIDEDIQQEIKEDIAERVTTYLWVKSDAFGRVGL